MKWRRFRVMLVFMVLTNLLTWSATASSTTDGIPVSAVDQQPKKPNPRLEESQVITIQSCTGNSVVDTTFNVDYYSWQNLGGVATLNGVVKIDIVFGSGSAAAEVKLVDAATGWETPKKVFNSSTPSQTFFLPNCGLWVVFISSASLVYDTHGHITATGM